MSGLWTTFEVLGWSTLVMFAAAGILGTARLSPRWYVRVPATCVVEFFRGTSAIVQLFWAFYVLPFAGISSPPMLTAVVVLGLNEVSYASEIVRAGIKSVPLGQVEATVALNLGRWKRFWRIIFPQAVPFMIPPFGNTLINLAKLTSLASLVTVSDLTFRAQAIRTNIGHTPLVFGIILVTYFLVSMVISVIAVAAERLVRRRVGGSAPGPGQWGPALRRLMSTTRTLPRGRGALPELEVTPR
jgi:polar amino acid transport system permease protein